ncbi:matrixin family metalloprotease [Emticicia sp. TH156]|uniref:matrixin family metalloprotease n=1 Tax=Emticicia sp. TH156 TaxID=2067454 RepID=UPI000C779996|nr:matrixin family metalloprotease [Emticicia sp. TH156]PLK42444.1 hypothetical protein C0V77_20735 [Emticicia sp. TH156]
MRNLYFSLFLLVAVLGCEQYYPVERLNLIANNLKKVPARTFSGCLVRYSIKDYYPKLTESVQRRAIDNAFAIWREANPNMFFINSADTNRLEVSIRFVNPNQISTNGQVADFGILKTTLQPISELRQVEGLRYDILLNNSFNWDEYTIQRAIGYQIGNYLGFPSSSEPTSMMYSLSSLTSKLSLADSVLYRQIYPLPCKDLGVNFLPIKFQLKGPVTFEIKLDKPGTVTIRSTGLINVGQFINECTPDGKTEFGGFIPIDAITYNIEPAFPHAAVIYKLNGETNWRLCKSNCEFSTSSDYITLTININDKNVSDNYGYFDVEVNYK